MARGRKADAEAGGKKKFTTKGGLVRETAYFHQNEIEALEEHARKVGCSKAEILRRALRHYLDLR